MPFHHPNRVRVSFDCGNDRITKQSHKQECDINFILGQYKRTGILNHINRNSPLYADLPDNLDYQQALATVATAANSFSSLPAVVRDYFDNDPSRFLAAFQDPSQLAKLQEFGLVTSSKSPTPPPEGGLSASTP